MRSILYNLVLVPAIAAAAFTTTAAVAETTLQVPFSFKVADKSYPAGTYSVERTHTGDFVTVKGKNAPNSFMWTVGPGAPAPTDARVVMNFDEQGQTHILRSVQFESSITSRLDKHIKQNERAPMAITSGQ
jgi:hypothetical protein